MVSCKNHGGQKLSVADKQIELVKNQAKPINLQYGSIGAEVLTYFGLNKKCKSNRKRDDGANQSPTQAWRGEALGPQFFRRPLSTDYIFRYTYRIRFSA